MKCIGHNCLNTSSLNDGRAICVEPDDDGWICEGCWVALTTNSEAVLGTANDEYTTNPQTIRQRARERGIEQRRDELDSVFIANQRARQIAEIAITPRRTSHIQEIEQGRILSEIRSNNEEIQRIVREVETKKPLSPFKVTALFILLIWFIIFCQYMYFG